MQCQKPGMQYRCKLWAQLIKINSPLFFYFVLLLLYNINCLLKVYTLFTSVIIVIISGIYLLQNKWILNIVISLSIEKFLNKSIIIHL